MTPNELTLGPLLWIFRSALVALAASLGASLGSFANVALERVPQGHSLLGPPSRCTTCSAPIPPYDNIPVVAWLALRGRCRACGSAIGLRTLALEIVGAVVGAVVAVALLALF